MRPHDTCHCDACLKALFEPPPFASATSPATPTPKEVELCPITIAPCDQQPRCGGTCVRGARGERSVAPIQFIGDRKPPLHLVLDFPRTLRAVAYQLEHGLSRPNRWRGSWRKQYDTPEQLDELIAKVLRHLLERQEGRILDEDNRPNAVAALVDLMILVELEGMP